MTDCLFSGKTNVVLLLPKGAALNTTLCKQREFFAKRLSTIIEQYRGSLKPPEYNLTFETLTLFHDLILQGRLLELRSERRYVSRATATVKKSLAVSTHPNIDFRRTLTRLKEELRNLPEKDLDLYELVPVLDVVLDTTGIDIGRTFPVLGKLMPYPYLLHHKIATRLAELNNQNTKSSHA